MNAHPTRSDVQKAATELTSCVRTMKALGPRLRRHLRTLEAAGWAGADELVSDDGLDDMHVWTIPMAEGILAALGDEGRQTYWFSREMHRWGDAKALVDIAARA
jgi:hypothetical protein